MRDDAMPGIPGAVADAIDEMLAVIGADEIASLPGVLDMESKTKDVLVVTELGIAHFTVEYGDAVEMGQGVPNRRFHVKVKLITWPAEPFTVTLLGGGVTGHNGYLESALLSCDEVEVKRTEANAQAFRDFATRAFALMGLRVPAAG